MKVIPLAKPSITQQEIDAVTDVLNSGQLSRGPIVTEFEHVFKKFYAMNHACAVSSGTAGLILALQALGVKAGDEVITVSFTVPATVNAIIAIGAKPVLLDIEEKNLGLDPIQLEQSIHSKIAAVIVVHAFGQAANIDQIARICKSQQVPLIEDACEAIGNRYKSTLLGRWGQFCVFGFYPNKQVTAAEGGMVLCHDHTLAEKIRLGRNHGRTMDGKLFDQVSHGWNFRLSEVHAAIGLAQFNRLKSLMAKRIWLAGQYHQLLSKAGSITVPKFSEHEDDSAWFVYVVKVAKNRDYLFNRLAEKGIQCGRYFAPVHQQVFWQRHHPAVKLPITEKVGEQTLALPFFYDLGTEQQRYICKNILQLIN